jgi:hypothetical protein
MLSRTACVRNVMYLWVGSLLVGHCLDQWQAAVLRHSIALAQGTYAVRSMHESRGKLSLTAVRNRPGGLQPFLVAEFVMANTWSMLLFIGNPTNLIVSQAARMSFLEYSRWMAGPTIGAPGEACLAVLSRPHSRYTRAAATGRATCHSSFLAQ